jgi:hypothetical protein
MKNYVRGYSRFINENINVPKDNLTPEELSNLFSDWINGWYSKKIGAIKTSGMESWEADIEMRKVEKILTETAQLFPEFLAVREQIWQYYTTYFYEISREEIDVNTAEDVWNLIFMDLNPHTLKRMIRHSSRNGL